MINSLFDRLFKVIPVFLLTIGLPATASGYGLPVVEPDATDVRAYYRQAVPKLLGRKVYGSQELEVLSQLDGEIGRENVLRLLMNEPEFIDHWSYILRDQLKTQYRNTSFDPSTDVRYCMIQPLLSNTTSRVAEFVRLYPGGVAIRGVETKIINFNMVDLIRSALLIDDLSPIYRAAMIPLAYQIPAYDFRPRAANFSNIYLNRDANCIGCHNTSDSFTDSWTGWDRHWPIDSPNLDVAVFSGNNLSFEPIIRNVHRIFLNDGIPRDANASSSETTFWGMTGCGDLNKEPTHRDFIRYVTTDGNTQEVREVIQGDPDPDSVVEAFGNSADIEGVNAYFAGISKQTFGMQTLIDLFEDGQKAVTAVYENPERAFEREQNSEEAFQADAEFYVMTMLSTTDYVWKEVMGENLTLEHGFPRNMDQRDMLAALTYNSISRKGFSLKDLLISILTSDYFGRKATSESNQEPYNLPRILNPWSQQDPREDQPEIEREFEYNSQGDLVHRHTPVTLRNSVSKLMDWPAAEPYFFSESAQIILRNDTPVSSSDLEYVRSSGQYISFEDEGTDSMDFQRFIVWEDRIGRCEKPEGIAEDWIDRLLEEVRAYNNRNARDISALELVSMIKSWILGDPYISSGPVSVKEGETGPSEAEMIRALFEVSSLNRSTDRVSSLERKARKFCGVLLKSPRFMLAGLEPSATQNSDGPTIRILNVCNIDNRCSFQEHCRYYSSRMKPNSSSLVCTSSNLKLESPFTPDITAQIDTQAIDIEASFEKFFAIRTEKFNKFFSPKPRSNIRDELIKDKTYWGPGYYHYWIGTYDKKAAAQYYNSPTFRIEHPELFRDVKENKAKK